MTLCFFRAAKKSRLRWRGGFFRRRGVVIASGIASPAANVKHAHVKNHRQQENSERALCGDDEVGRERTTAKLSDRGEKHLTTIQNRQREEIEDREVYVNENRED